jgi:thiosulfate/3-mercaptopyruvate sulfurtransferase
MGVLIEVDELAELLASAQPPVVVDVRWVLGGPTQLPAYREAHIRGARWIDLDAELSAPVTGRGGRHPLPTPEAFQASIRRIGIDDESTVVVYDSDNALAASRLWWMLVDAGHRDVRVLNGGFAAWTAAGREVSTGEEKSPAPGNFTARPGQLPQIGGDELAQRIATGDAPMIIDVRGAERYAGESEPIDPVAGHIPGAINVPSMINIGEDGKLLSPEQIAANFPDTDQGPVVYCGSGITAAHTTLARVAAGLPVSTVYPGSWSDWITDSSRPIATGDRP